MAYDADYIFHIMQDLMGSVAWATMIARYATFSAWTLLIWDWFVCLEREVAYFWKKPWSWATVLYMLNRYPSMILNTAAISLFIIPHPDQYICNVWLRLVSWSGVGALTLTQIILATRVFALWNNSKMMLGVLAFALFATVTSMSVIVGIQTTRHPALDDAVATIDWHACTPCHVETWFLAMWFIPLSFEILCFLLAAFKGLSTMHLKYHETSKTRLIDVLMRDSVLWFLAIVMVELACAILWLKGPIWLIQSSIGFAWAIPSVIASHLMIHLREAYYGSETDSMMEAGTDGDKVFEQTKESFGGTDGSHRPARRQRRDNYSFWSTVDHSSGSDSTTLEHNETQ